MTKVINIMVNPIKKSKTKFHIYNMEYTGSKILGVSFDVICRFTAGLLEICLRLEFILQRSPKTAWAKLLALNHFSLLIHSKCFNLN